jgi:hypothetical protein
MHAVTQKTINGFNEFLETHQSLPGEALLTLVKFDTKYEIVHNGVNVKDVPHLNDKTYQPNGMTALFDAVGRSIDEVGKRYDGMKKKDRPAQVIFLIMTDGEENSSKEYKIEAIKEKTKKRQDEDKWEFVFMGADQDAWSAGGGMGISQNVNYTVNDTQHMFMKAAYFSANSRTYSKNKSMKNFDLSDDEVQKGLEDLKKDQDNTPKT